jgi:Trp operon repressor
MQLIIDPDERAAIHERLLRIYHDGDTRIVSDGLARWQAEQKAARVARANAVRAYHEALMDTGMSQREATWQTMCKFDLARGTVNAMLRGAR